MKLLLTRAIQQLEEGIDAKLFEIHQRKVVLTSAGEYLKSESLFNQMSAMEVLVKHVADGAAGKLNLTFVGSVILFIQPYLRAFTARYPKQGIVASCRFKFMSYALKKVSQSKYLVYIEILA